MRVIFLCEFLIFKGIMPVCQVCSGKDFICDSGYYFCAECQTQSQDIRQQVVDDRGDIDDDPDQFPENKTRKRKRSEYGSSTIQEENMTTWEGFNFSLVGLVDQLIRLGAKPVLKAVVLDLWTKYLGKMEVAFYSHDSSSVPKLGPNFKKSDAEIIYGLARTKRTLKNKKQVDANTSCKKDGTVTDSSNSSMSGKDFSRKRSKVIREDYDRVMHEMSIATQSLADVTLEMLSVSNVETERKPLELQFNALGESKQEFHKSDFFAHPGLLVRNRLIAILYLGLIICRESINLSDILRWIREGHLWYGKLSEFFPPSVVLQAQNRLMFQTYQPCPPYGLLIAITGSLARYIGVKSMPVPPMKEFISKYVKELNLPTQIGVMAERLYDLLPQSQMRSTDSRFVTLANWEGFAMAHIIVVLKLLFGLDDATEHRNSRIAAEINRELESIGSKEHLFVWDTWERFCVARRTALSVFHLPSVHKITPPPTTLHNAKPFVVEWGSFHHTCRTPSNGRAGVMVDAQKSLLNKLKDNSDDNDLFCSMSYPPCSTPLSTYTKLLVNAIKKGEVEDRTDEWGEMISSIRVDVLSTDFSSWNTDYLTHPERFVEWANLHGVEVGLHTGSAACSFQPQEKKNNSAEGCHNLRVKVVFRKTDEVASFHESLNASLNSSMNTSINSPQRPISHNCRLVRFHKALVLPRGKNFGMRKNLNDPFPEICDLVPNGGTNKPVEENSGTWKKGGRPKLVKKSYEDLKVTKENENKMLHVPHTEYWLSHFEVSENMDLKDNENKLPYSFLRLLNECGSLLEMRPGLLYKEVMCVEVLHADLFSSDLRLDLFGSSVQNTFSEQHRKWTRSKV